MNNKETSLHIDWPLSMDKEAVMTTVQNIMKRHRGHLTTDGFLFYIRRSWLLGIAWRKEIKVNGTVTSEKNGSRLSVAIEMCAPYKYVELTAKRLLIVIPILLLSWVGLIFINTLFTSLKSFWLLLAPIFFVTCLILLIGFERYYIINDKFIEVKSAFSRAFENVKIE